MVSNKTWIVNRHAEKVCRNRVGGALIRTNVRPEELRGAPDDDGGPSLLLLDAWDDDISRSDSLGTPPEEDGIRNKVRFQIWNPIRLDCDDDGSVVCHTSKGAMMLVMRRMRPYTMANMSCIGMSVNGDCK